MTRIPLDKHALTLARFRDVKALTPQPGARLYIYQPGTTEEVTAYDAPSGGSTITYPLEANDSGEYRDVWVEAGFYDLYSPDDILNPTVPWGLLPGAQGPTGSQGPTGPQGQGASPFMHGNAFGMDKTGVSDSTDAFQDFLDTLTTSGGEGWLEPGYYKCAGSVHVDHPAGPSWRLHGPGGYYAHNQGPCTIEFTGTDGGIKIWSAWNFEIDHLRLVHSNNNPSAVNLLDLDGRGGSGGWSDVMRFHIHHLSSAGTHAGVMAKSGIRLSAAIIGDIDHCHMTGCSQNIRLADPGGPYVVGVSIGPTNTFNFTDEAHIGVGTTDGENINIFRNIFEDPGNGNAAIKGDHLGNALYGFGIQDNWFGDAGEPVNWIEGLNLASNEKQGVVSGNRMADPGGANGFHFKGLTGTWSLLHNTCEGGKIFGNRSDGVVPCQGGTIIGNSFNTSHGIWETNRPNVYTALNNTCVNTSKLLDCIPTMGFGSRNFAEGPLPATDGLIVVGAHSGATLTDHGNRAALYVTQSSGQPDTVVVAAPADNDGLSKGVLAAGATPAAKVLWDHNGVAFNGATPARPEITGSRGGNAALQDLLQSLEDIGLITDNSS